MIKALFNLLYVTLMLSVSVTAVPGCYKQNPSGAPTYPSSSKPAPTGKKYLALGDSYTIGQGVQTTERFPHLTASLLRQEGFDVQKPQYIAMTGWTSAQLLSAINNQTLPSTFDMITLLIGVNDQFQGLDTGGYRLQFTQLLNKAVALAGNRPYRVFVLSIPDYSATPFVPASQKSRVSREIDDFNFINKQIAAHNNVAYISITPLTREAANDSTLLAPDGLHYSAKEHGQWAALLVPVIKNALR